MFVTRGHNVVGCELSSKDLKYNSSRKERLGTCSGVGGGFGD